MTSWIRHSLQVMTVGLMLMGLGVVAVIILAFVDRAAIAGWPLVTLLAGIALLLGGMVSSAIGARRSHD